VFLCDHAGLMSPVTFERLQQATMMYLFHKISTRDVLLL
jgi:hypothetical protein